MISIPTLSESLFAGADRGTSQVDRTLQRREEYESTAQYVARLYGVTADDLDRFGRLYSAWLGACGRCLSSFIAGPSNFPVRRAQKANASEGKRRRELNAFVKRLEGRAKRQEKEDAIEAAGGAAAVAQAEIEQEKARLSQMKAANKIVRAKPKNASTPEKLAALAVLGLDGYRGSALFEKDFSGRYGFPAFQLTAARTAIKRREEKLEALAKRDASADLEDDEIHLAGLTVILSWSEDRLQVRHDAKPAHDVRQNLKRHGFNWSRTAGAWQRQLTAGGFLSWQAIIGAELALGIELQAEPAVKAASDRLS